MSGFAGSFLLAQVDGGGGGIDESGGGLFLLPLIALYFVVIGVGLAGLWKTFAKAGRPGWAAIVPIYNFIVLLEIAGKPIWWLLLMLVPCVQLIIVIMISLDVAKNFGRSQAFGLGLAFLGFIFYPILGFGDARYQGPRLS